MTAKTQKRNKRVTVHRKSVKCGACNHKIGFRRDAVRVNEWLCKCHCHVHEQKLPKKEHKKYSIKEIKEYLKGCLLMSNFGKGYTTDMVENVSLKNAIHDISDSEDGIEAVINRCDDTVFSKFDSSK